MIYDLFHAWARSRPDILDDRKEARHDAWQRSQLEKAQTGQAIKERFMKKKLLATVFAGLFLVGLPGAERKSLAADAPDVRVAAQSAQLAPRRHERESQPSRLSAEKAQEIYEMLRSEETRIVRAAIW